MSEGYSPKGFEEAQTSEGLEAPIGKMRSDLGDKLEMLGPEANRIFREAIARAGISDDQIDEYINVIDNPMVANRFIQEFVTPIISASEEEGRRKASKRAKEALVAIYGKQKDA